MTVLQQTDRQVRNRQTTAGLFLYLAGMIIIMGIITGEIFYPSDYSTSINDISDLGSTRPPDIVIHQLSATIFNVTMLLAGGLILLATRWLHRFYHKWNVTIPLGLFGLGILGVGLFPGNVTPFHGIFSLLTFVAGGISAILLARITQPPFRYLAILLGSIGLLFLFTSNWWIPILGSGGTERWVAYPIVLWLIGFGGYLLGLSTANHFSTKNQYEK